MTKEILTWKPNENIIMYIYFNIRNTHFGCTVQFAYVQNFFSVLVNREKATFVLTSFSSEIIQNMKSTDKAVINL